MTQKLMKSLEIQFKSKVDNPRIKQGKNQAIEKLINEEALLFAKFLRNEKIVWNPRIVQLKNDCN